MGITLTVDLALTARTWHNSGSWLGLGAGDWRIYSSEGAIANSDTPNGWSVSVDDTATPTKATIAAPLEAGDFSLRTSVIQSQNSPGGATSEGLSPSVGYSISIFSSVTESVPVGPGSSLPGGKVYSGGWDVRSRGPMSEIANADTDTYDGTFSSPGERRFTPPDNIATTYLQVSASITAYQWELRNSFYTGSMLTGGLVQSGNDAVFVFDNELEPGEEYTLKLTTTNNFGKSGTRTQTIEGQALAAYYDRATGMIRVMYKTGSGPGGRLRYANYPGVQKPELNTSNPTIANYQVFQAPHSTFRYGAQIRAITSSSGVLSSDTEGFTWLQTTPNSTRRLYGATISPDGSITFLLYKTRIPDDDANIYWGLTGTATTGLEGFKRPSAMLNIGNGYILIAKLGNDVVCASSQDGITWAGGGVVSPDSRLIGAFKTADHSIVSVMVIPRGGSPQLVRLFNTGDGWDIHDATNVTGLPETLRTPAAVDSDGIRTVLVYTDGDGHGMAISDDLGLAWEVAEG